MNWPSIAWKLFAGFQIYVATEAVATFDIRNALDVIGYLFLPIVSGLVILYAFDQRISGDLSRIGLIANVYVGFYTLGMVLSMLQLLPSAQSSAETVGYLLAPLVAAPFAFFEWLAMQRFSRGETVNYRSGRA